MKINCIKCGLEWNVSDMAVIPRDGYICPPCRRITEEKRRGGDSSGKAKNRRVGHMGGSR